MRTPPPSSDRVFNNADSFAQAFDEAWSHHCRQHPEDGLDSPARRDLILEEIRDHPFLQEQPSLARQVADFRVRLLGLDRRRP